VLGRDDRLDFAFAAQGQAVGQVFLDRDLLALRIGGQIDDRKTAERKLAVYRVLLELVAGWEAAGWLVAPWISRL
jgi:hypothetical protein